MRGPSGEERREGFFAHLSGMAGRRVGNMRTDIQWCYPNVCLLQRVRAAAECSSQAAQRSVTGHVTDLAASGVSEHPDSEGYRVHYQTEQSIAQHRASQLVPAISTKALRPTSPTQPTTQPTPPQESNPP